MSTPSCSNAKGRSVAAPGIEATRAASSDSQYEATKAADPLHFVVGGARVEVADGDGQLVALESPRLREVEVLEEVVHGAADLGRGEAALATGRALSLDGTEPDDSLRVEAVGAALERGKRVNESFRTRLSGGPGTGTSSASCGAAPAARAPSSLAKRASCSSSASGETTESCGSSPPRSRRSKSRAPSRSISTGPFPVSSSPAAWIRSSTQPIGVEASAPRSGSIEPETMSRSIALVIAT